ncbi:MotB family protein [Nitratireductor sp. ZSWI3]|uniref:MotB family protein n=1 Tax=Nitratireductor sp. ZSWI3 TaxID=2966359 RepID=UPI0021501CF2|nr:MotB family protein [Nitratireductor sp. ZSWI3]MCR4264799.1 MotB family protein [Nitratireductor sp. ZSWI3]
MSMAEGDGRPPEIIIVRRGGGDEDDGHHGGAWKIAFADFMTAMMCFFLVMWLINASNEQTRSALASYFNPVKLIDRNTSTRGLEDIGEAPAEATQENGAEKDGEKAPSNEESRSSGPMDFDDAVGVSEMRQVSDDSLFSDPYAVLAEIVADAETQANVSTKGEGGAQTAGPSSGASGGESYRDPFAPDFWSQQVATPDIGVQGDPDAARDNPAGTEVEATNNGKHTPAGADLADPQADERMVALPSVPDVEPLAPGEKPADTAAETSQPHDPGPAADVEAPPARETAVADEIPAAVRDIAATMQAELARQFAGSPLAGSVDVAVAEDGVVISITDDLEHGMFPVGSAVPDRELVLAMDKIGQVLAGRAGTVRIGGHTDGRPFRSEAYDNWRLSTARAQAAYYMLVRGGLDEQRIRQVAGFADRKLKVPGDPYASANRRIEILLELPR